MDERLSEDIDLIAVSHRNDTVEQLNRLIPSALARTHGRAAWSPGWSLSNDVEPATLVTPSGLTVKIQLLAGTHDAKWPTGMHQIEQRYADAPPATLRVPTKVAFDGQRP